MTAKRRPGRRPVLEGLVYHRGMCDRVIKVGKRGGSRTAMALACGVSTAQLRRWARRHAEFAHAYEMANTYAEAHWERLGAAHLEDPTFNHSIWLNFMRRYEEPDRHLRFRRQHKPTSVPDVAAMMITRVVTSSPTGSGSNDDAP